MLRAFSRLALRAPEEVADALHELNPHQAVQDSDSSEVTLALLDVLPATTPHITSRGGVRRPASGCGVDGRGWR